MTQEDSRMHILRMIEEGKISADEGFRLLNAMKAPVSPAASASSDALEAAGPNGPASPVADPQIRYWRNWWQVPMIVGTGILILGALAMYSALQSSGLGFWFLCAWAPFLAGLGLVALAWASRTSRWVHLRAETGDQEWPRKFMLSLPIPLKVIAWAIRTFGQRLPALKRTSVDELITAIDESATPEAPIYIDVHEGEKGERVQVYIG